MTRLLSLAFLLVLPSFALGQGRTAWDVDIDLGVDRHLPSKLAPTPDGGVVAIGVGTAPDGTDRAALAVRLDENGDVLWSVSIPAPEGQFNLWWRGVADGAVDADGNLYLVVSRSPNSALRKYDADGNLLWGRMLISPTPGGDFFADRVVLAPDGSPVACGTTMRSTFPYFTLHKYDAQGNAQWVEESIQGGAWGVLVGPSGEFLFHGQSDVYPWQFLPKIARYLPDGTFDWEVTLTATNWSWAEDLDVDASGDVFVVYTERSEFSGDAAFEVASFDSAGAQRYSTTYAGTFGARGRGIAVDAGGSVYVAGEEQTAAGTGSTPPATMATYRFDASGTFEWARMPSLGLGQSGGVEPLVDAAGNVHVAGWTLPAAGGLVETSLRPDGSERWANVRSGATPWTWPDQHEARLDVALDTRGNLLAFGQASEPQAGAAFSVVKYPEPGAVGSPYCGPAVTNSTGLPASLVAAGAAAVAADNVTLVASDLPPGTFTLFLCSRLQGSTPFLGGGQGTLCLASPIGRYAAPGQLRVSDDAGSASLQLALQFTPQPTGAVAVVSGETWNFQAWYRDWNPAATSNLTDATSILFP